MQGPSFRGREPLRHPTDAAPVATGGRVGGAQADDVITRSRCVQPDGLPLWIGSSIDRSLGGCSRSEADLRRTSAQEVGGGQRPSPTWLSKASPRRSRLGSSECDEQCQVMIVGCSERRDIATPCLAFQERRLTPRESFATTSHDKEIRHQARDPSVAIRKRMDRNEAMMKTNGELVARIGAVLHPIPGVVDEQSHSGPDLRRIDSDVAVRGPVGAGPSPDIAEHPSV